MENRREKLYKCPSCGAERTGIDWEEESNNQYSGDQMGINDANDTTYFWCSTCKEEIKFEELEDVGEEEILYACPECEETNTGESWNQVTLNYFGGNITKIENADGFTSFSCPSCKEISDCRDIKRKYEVEKRKVFEIGDRVLTKRGDKGIVTNVDRSYSRVELVIDNQIIVRIYQNKALEKIGGDKNV